MRILLAEDEKALSNALVAIFKHNNFSIDAVYNGEDALDYLESGIYDIAILDIMMPKMDGVEVLKRMRSAGISIPVIMLTAKAELDDKIQGLDSGADDYLTKPFEVKELLARIRALSRRKKTEAQSNLSFGNTTLNRSTYELSAAGGSFRLCNKEFQLMEMLMLNPKNLISAEHFMEKIWGFDSDAEINVVRVYISYLRKKLMSSGANITIKANRNIGYSLEMLNDN